MQKFVIGLAGAALAGVLAATPALADGPEIGRAAPTFTLTDSNGKTVSLKQFRGKRVVLEWTNHLCPYTVKHYTTQNMQGLQKDAASKGVVWLTIISSAPGTQGHVSSAKANELTRSRGAAPAHVLFDPEGTVGRMYGAKTTPHMYVIKKDGTLAYMGAIDDNRSWLPSTVKGAKNYVRNALADLAAGRDVREAKTFPYGCSVKYKEGA